LDHHLYLKTRQNLNSAHINLDITYLGLLLTRSCTTLRDVSYQYKYPSLPAQGLFPEPLKTLIWKPLGARYSCAAYSWIAWSPWFTDLVTLSDHPHVINVIALLYRAVMNGDRYLCTTILQSSDTI